MERESAGQSEWSRVLGVSSLLKRTSDSFELDEDKEWLRHVIWEAAAGMQSSVMWAAEAGAEGTSPRPQSLATRYLVAADAARSDAVVASYCLDFMLSQNLIEGEVAQSVGDQLSDLEGALRSYVDRIR